MDGIVAYRFSRADGNYSSVGVLLEAVMRNGIEKQHLLRLSVVDVHFVVKTVFYVVDFGIIEAEHLFHTTSGDVFLDAYGFVVNKGEVREKLDRREISDTKAFFARVHREVKARVISAKPLPKSSNEIDLEAKRLTAPFELADKGKSLSRNSENDDVNKDGNGDNREHYADIAKHSNQHNNADNDDDTAKREKQDREDRSE